MRNRDTSAATAARVRAKHDRWIKELTEAGYFVAEPRDGIVLYATSDGETWGRAQVTMSDEGGAVMRLKTSDAEIALAGVTWHR